MSRVDVIIPCYNYGRFLRECVESVLGQQVDLRVLIIDDCSSDDTPQVAASLAAEDPRVDYRRHEVNRGHIATYNEGLEWADSDYMLLISADDLLFPDALPRATQLLDEHPDVGLTTGSVVAYQSGDPRPLARDVGDGPRWKVCGGLEWLANVCEEQGDCITTPDVVVRTSVQKRLGGYRPDLPYSGDIEMFIRFALTGSIGVINADQAIYRKHGSNMHKSRDWHHLALASDRKRAFAAAFRDFGQGSGRERQLERLASRSIVRCLLWKACKSIDAGGACVPFEEILEFAFRAYPRTSCLREYWAMRSRLACGGRLWPLLRRIFRKRGVHRPRLTGTFSKSEWFEVGTSS